MKTKTLGMHPHPIENKHKPGMFEILNWKITAFGGKLRDVHVLGVRENYINLSQLEEITADFDVKLNQTGDIFEVIVRGKENAIRMAEKLNSYDLSHIGIAQYDGEDGTETYVRLYSSILRAERKNLPWHIYKKVSTCEEYLKDLGLVNDS